MSIVTNLSMIKTLVIIIHLLLCARASFLENRISSLNGIDTVLGKFFMALNRAYLRKEEPWYVVAISKSTIPLDGILNPYFRRYPMVVCSDVRACSYPSAFISSSLFTVFLDDLQQDTLANKVRILSSCKSDCKLLFVLLNDTVSIKNTDLIKFFRYNTKHDLGHGELIHANKDFVRHYSASKSHNCSMKIDSGIVWRPGNDPRDMSLELFRLRDHKGCPMTIAATPHMSKVVVEKKEDGSFRIVGGRDGMLALMIAEKLNRTVDFKYPDSSDTMETVYMIIFGSADFVITRLYPKTNNAMISVMTFENECVTLAVPRIMKSSYDVVVSEFPLDVWALIGLVFVIGCVLERISNSLTFTRNVRRSVVGFVGQILNVVSIHVGIPVTRDPLTMGGKFLFLGYLCYATVMTTAYKTFLSSILSTVKIMPTITDVHGVIKANFTVGGSTYYNLLNSISSENDAPWKLMKRYQIEDNYSKALNRLELDLGFVYLASRSALTRDKELIVKSRRLIKYNILETCVFEYPAALGFPKGSHLIKSVNKIILQVLEFGLLDYWDHASYVDDDILESLNAERFFGQNNMEKLISAFIFYFACIAVSVFVFLVEIMTR